LEPRYNMVSGNISIKLRYAPVTLAHAFAGKVRNPLMSGNKQPARPLLDITRGMRPTRGQTNEALTIGSVSL